jgi:chorismate mutase
MAAPGTLAPVASVMTPRMEAAEQVAAKKMNSAAASVRDEARNRAQYEARHKARAKYSRREMEFGM